MKNILITACVSLLAATSAYAGKYDLPRVIQDSFVVDGKVVSSRPNIRTYTVRVPTEVCWTEKAKVNKSSGNSGNPLLGAIIGGVIGNQIGDGSGRKIATVTGALIGAAAGSDNGKGESYHYQDVERCKVEYTRETKFEADGYVTKVEVLGKTISQKTKREFDVGSYIPVTFSNPRF